MSPRIKQVLSEIAASLNVSSDMEPREDVLASVRAGVTFKGSQLLVLIFAIFIASLGLNTNSIPVIIGAMLISPLMGPIIGMGVAIGIQDFELLKRGLKNISLAVAGSLIASALYFLVSPQYEGASQLLARTSPSIYDVGVALFGGAAGIVSIACRNKGQVMPGVAIATSLMPPLCTAGYGLATMQMQFFLGALYLFFINTIFILFASWIGVRLMGYRSLAPTTDSPRAKRVQLTVYILVFLTIGFSIYLTVGMFQKGIFQARASEFVEKEMVFPNTQVLNHREYIKHGKRFIDVTLIGEALPKDSLQLAMLSKLDSLGLGGTSLNITQGFSIKDAKTGGNQDFDKYFALTQQAMVRSREEVDSLKRLLAAHRRFSDESAVVAPEIKVLFPSVHDFAMSRMVAASPGTGMTDTVDVLFVAAPAGLPVTERKKMTEYMQVRLKSKTVHISVNPPGFPWPQREAKK